MHTGSSPNTLVPQFGIRQPSIQDLGVAELTPDRYEKIIRPLSKRKVQVMYPEKRLLGFRRAQRATRSS